MQTPLSTYAFSPGQRQLWEKTQSLWELSRSRNKEQICAALHPEYVDWDMSTRLPHDREAAVGSVTDDAPVLPKDGDAVMPRRSSP